MTLMTLPIVNPQSAKKPLLQTQFQETMHRTLPSPPTAVEFTRNVEVVRLAIELARLRESTKPGEHLAEAAKLITEAGVAMVNEEGRPEQEQAEEGGRLASEMIRCDTIPRDIIFQPGKREGGDGGESARHNIASEEGSFQWATFRSEKGFSQLLAKHYGNICTKAAEEMRPMLCEGNPRTDDAQHYLRSSGLFFDDETAERLREIKNAHDGTMFLGFWQSRAVSKTVDAVVERTKAGWLNSATLKAFAQTRMDGHIARAKRAITAKKGTRNTARNGR